MKKIFFLLVLSLIVFNCSEDDEGNVTITFLEKHGGSIWQESGSVEYFFRFINNVDNPLESWFLWDNCYEYSLTDFGESQTIIRNSNNTLEVEFIEFDGGFEYRELVVITVSGSSLELAYEFFENGELYESGSEFYVASSTNVDDLDLCD